jgi:alginate O-acetyltransferase complex protein AlgI
MPNHAGSVFARGKQHHRNLQSMVFASIEFVAFFLPIFLFVYFVSPARFHNLILLIASWIFYAWWKPVFLGLLVFVCTIAWSVALLIDNASSEAAKTRLLVAGIVVEIGILAWFKYANLAVATVSDLLAVAQMPPLSWEPVFLPIGLSFFILQSISYLVDVRRQEIRAQSSYIAFAAYLSMFSQLIAGPIVRYATVSRELFERRSSFTAFSRGSRLFMIGFAQKALIADTLAPIVDVAFRVQEPTLADAWLGSLAYGFQLYFDFSGYSLMAIGLGLMVGFHFPDNFNNPYLARSLQDFWRRWHMTLSSWLRDYVYIPLGGSRRGTTRAYASLFATMALGGLWHGASWTFLAWGAVHGLALAIERVVVRQLGLGVPGLASYILTMGVVFFGWTSFRASDWVTAMRMLAGQIGLHGIPLGQELAVELRPTQIAWLAAGVVVVAWPAVQEHLPALMRQLPAWWHDLWPVALFVVAIATLLSRDTVPFLYFQF